MPLRVKEEFPRVSHVESVSLGPAASISFSSHPNILWEKGLSKLRKKRVYTELLFHKTFNSRIAYHNIIYFEFDQIITPINYLKENKPS